MGDGAPRRASRGASGPFVGRRRREADSAQIRTGSSLSGAFLDTAPTPDNVEIVKRANAAFNAGEFEASLEVFAPDAELVDLANAPDQQSAIKGRNAIREAWDLWEAAFDRLRAEVEEYSGVGDFVICASHWVGEGKGSGISIDIRQFDLYEFRDGKVVAATLGFRSKREALEATGLEG
jgi:ketosteroid isomerase-like protein